MASFSKSEASLHGPSLALECTRVASGSLEALDHSSLGVWVPCLEVRVVGVKKDLPLDFRGKAPTWGLGSLGIILHSALSEAQWPGAMHALAIFACEPCSG